MAKNKNGSSLDTLRHSLAHIMALALKRIYGEVIYGVGPTIENGFYYDVEIKNKTLNKTLTEKDLEKIEQEMRKIIEEKLPFKKKYLSLKEAETLFKKLKQNYKLELIKDLRKYGTTVENEKENIKNKKSNKINKVSIYEVGEFVDLCRGPHVKNTSELPLSFKLTKVSGAYWRGKEENPMLQRITGVAFQTQKELKDYLNFIKEAEERDHRYLGEKLDLFHFDENLGPGLVLWHPKGAMLKKIIEEYALNEYLKNGYELVNTPHIAQLKLWKISGHADFYKESMYPAMHLKEINEEENIDYEIKPMNCPFHILIYKNKIVSYKDLPLRYTELGTVYRYEKSGVLHGLNRVRGFTQDDAHIWCSIKDLPKEIEGALELALKILNKFGFKDFEIDVSTRPEKFIGQKKVWDIATKSLTQTLEKKKIKYFIDRGGGAFYGPKIDIKIKDAIGRAWQCTTIQVDFNLPQRFEMTYIDKNGRKEQPIMIHRALLGSLERFIGILIEHYKGEFPLWLAPVQVMVLPILEENQQFGKKVLENLKEKGFRTEIDLRNETLSKRIREAELLKIPYLAIIGKKEEKAKKIAIRQRKIGDLGQMPIEKFEEKMRKEL
ncbi:MAG TPA: threonine--tRNA ligase [Candidatus Paceibacterota bacterium]|nr:threonine--tRNA ligase [Candidatus Paceibacterota bacterium]